MMSVAPIRAGERAWSAGEFACAEDAELLPYCRTIAAAGFS